MTALELAQQHSLNRNALSRISSHVRKIDGACLEQDDIDEIARIVQTLFSLTSAAAEGIIEGETVTMEGNETCRI